MFLITRHDGGGQECTEIDCWPDVVAWLAEYKPRGDKLSHMNITMWSDEPEVLDMTQVHEEALLENFLHDSQVLAEDHETEVRSL